MTDECTHPGPLSYDQWGDEGPARLTCTSCGYLENVPRLVRSTYSGHDDTAELVLEGGPDEWERLGFTGPLFKRFLAARKPGSHLD